MCRSCRPMSANTTHCNRYAIMAVGEGAGDHRRDGDAVGHQGGGVVEQALPFEERDHPARQPHPVRDRRRRQRVRRRHDRAQHEPCLQRQPWHQRVRGVADRWYWGRPGTRLTTIPAITSATGGGTPSRLANADTTVAPTTRASTSAIMSPDLPFLTSVTSVCQHGGRGPHAGSRRFAPSCGGSHPSPAGLRGCAAHACRRTVRPPVAKGADPSRGGAARLRRTNLRRSP